MPVNYDRYDKEKCHLWQVMNHFNIKGIELADAIHVDPSMVSRWFSGAKRLSVNSKSMENIADFFLNRTLTSKDRDWLIRRFTLAGFPGRYENIKALKTGLINFLANDGSSLDDNDPMKNGVSGKEFFTIAGYNDILLNLHHFTEGLKDGSEVWFFTTGGSIEVIRDFRNEISELLNRRLHVTLLMSVDGDGEGSESNILGQLSGLLVRQGIRAGILREKRAQLAETMWILVPGMCCMEIISVGKSIPLAASVICNVQFVEQTLVNLQQIFSQAEPLFQRSVSVRDLEWAQKKGNEESREVLVISDGLDPMFMLPGRFKAYLQRKGEAEETIAWKYEQFQERRQAFEENLASGMKYDEINSGRFLVGKNKVRIYGNNLFEENTVDPETAWDILDGCCQLASKYADFTVRMGRPVPMEFDRGYYRLQDGNLLLRYHDHTGAKYSENETLAARLRDNFHELWEAEANTRRIVSGSGTLELLRRKMREVGELLQEKE